jgi:hypothetical protein
MLEVLGRREPHLVERARRELSRMVGRDLGPLPSRGERRDAWIAELRDSIVGQEPVPEPGPEPSSEASSEPK